MNNQLVQLAEDIIDMRKHPLRSNARERYPTAMQKFADEVNACNDTATLREIIRVDSGHVLPPPIKQIAYEKLLAQTEQRTPGLLRAFAMHLVMFGYTDENGVRIHDTDDRVNELYDEAEAKDVAG